MSAFRRFLTATAVAFWMGGFTFYAAVVIPTAHGVLGSHREVGFITQQVTRWLNLSAVVALALLAWQFFAGRAALPLARRRWLLATLAVMALAQVALFIEHPMLDGLLDGENQTIASGAHFYSLHRVYLLTAAVQWLAAMLHAWAWLRAATQKFQTT